MLESKANQPIPAARMELFIDGEWRSVNTAEHFGTGRHVIFALPGAFTPTCSSAHLPGYEAAIGAFTAAGVDSVTCVSVNDRFVMEAWRREQDVQHVIVAADGNGDFTRAMGMACDKTDLGFGERSWRYAMVVNDGVIEEQFIEPNQPGDPFEVSDADTVLDWVQGHGTVPAITLFTRQGCGHCSRAKSVLEAAGLPYAEVPVTSPRVLRAVSPQQTTPQVFVDGIRVGGADDLQAWLVMRPTKAA